MSRYGQGGYDPSLCFTQSLFQGDDFVHYVSLIWFVELKLQWLIAKITASPIRVLPSI